MFKKITNFIKYHNAFAVVVAIIFTAAVSTMAASSNDLRDAVLGEKIVTESGIDNSRLLIADLDNFDLQMTIISISEDDKKYYVEYSFETFGIQDNIWQAITSQPTLTVYKDALGDNDLGLYVTEKLSQVADYQLSYLKEAQDAEMEKGKRQIVETTQYTGLYHNLVGKVLDIKEKVLPDYKPVVVVETPVIEPAPTPAPTVANPPVDTTITTTAATDTTDITTVSLQCDGDHPDLCDEASCETDGEGHWYEGACYNNNLAVGSAYYQWLKSNCLSNNKFWYDDACHDDDVCEEKTFYPDADGDGFGDLDLDNSVSSCEQPDGYVSDNTDCDDGNVEINPDGIEICGNDIDENCDGVDDVCEVSGGSSTTDDSTTDNPTSQLRLPDGQTAPGTMELIESEEKAEE